MTVPLVDKNKCRDKNNIPYNKMECTYSKLLYSKIKNCVADYVCRGEELSFNNTQYDRMVMPDVTADCHKVVVNDTTPKMEKEPASDEQFIDVLIWTVEDVASWVSRIGFPTAAFVDAGVDGDLLLQLDDRHLREDLGVTNGLHRKRFLRELAGLRRNADYSARDHSNLAGFLSSRVGGEYRGYAYDLLRSDLTLELMQRSSEADLHDLLKEAGVKSGIHRLRIVEAVLGGGSGSSSNMATTPSHSSSALSCSNSSTPAPVDVYVTYPAGHEGAELASLLKMQLQLRGLSVYSASHPENALRYVREARAFVCVLSGPGALDSCVGDLSGRSALHREVTAALRHDCVVVPVIDGGFVFPEAEELPEDMRALVSFNGVRWAHDYQEACVDKLERFLRGEAFVRVTRSGRSTPTSLGGVRTPNVPRKERSRTFSSDSAISNSS